jgi:hypothetical protein
MRYARVRLRSESVRVFGVEGMASLPADSA